MSRTSYSLTGDPALIHAGDIPSRQPDTRRARQSRETVSPLQTAANRRILYEFYEKAKLEGQSCHATYILGGLVEEGPPAENAMQIDTDDFPMSSPPVATQESTKSRGGSKMVRTVLLADENELDGSL